MAALKKKAPTRKVAKKTATRTVATKAAARKAASTQSPSAKSTSAKTRTDAGATKKHRVYGISFASVYPLYVQKAENKGRTKAEVDEVIAWLTGYEGELLQRAIAARVDLETFFAEAPRLNPNAALITGVVCGVRVEDLTDPLMQKIRYMDKLVDELAKGKAMARILRQ